MTKKINNNNMMLRTTALPVLLGFLLGLMCSSLILIVPEYMTMKKFFTSPTNNNYYLNQISELSSSMFKTFSETKNKKVPKLLCWIMTAPSNHRTKAVHVKRTWGAHCDKLMFMSEKEDKHLGAIKLEVPEGRQGLWGKTKRGFKYVYEHHYDEYEWFMKADDDTFVIVENLKDLLSNYDTMEPIHFGHHFKYLGGYFAGGAGYVLSRTALKRFVVDGINNSTICHQKDDGDEDVNLGGCMRKLNVTHGDSRDEQKLKRFFPFEPRDHIIPKSGKKDWAYELYTKWPEKNGTACCSDTAISFHYISPQMQYVMYYLVYHLRLVTHPTIPDEEILNVTINS